MKKLTLLFLIFTSIFNYGQNLSAVTELVEKELKTKKVPAIAVIVIDSLKVKHLKAHGFKDWDKKEKATVNTAFHLASVSKTITNLAIFKLVEQNKINLNVDVNKYLPFEIQNPYFENDIITIRELLNHRSGIRDDYDIYLPHWTASKGDSKIKLKDFLKDYLTENGKLYKKEHFGKELDYKNYKYSNTGIALLGLIIETVSGLSFEEFSQKNIFKPLGMKNTSWFLKDLNSNEVAKTYTYEKNELIFKGHNGYPDYPGGQLRTSISDLSKLLIGYLNADNSSFILSKKTIDKITPDPRTSQEGNFTWYLMAVDDNIYYYHTGVDTGVRTIVMIDIIHKNAIAVIANADYEIKELAKNITKKVWSK